MNRATLNLPRQVADINRKIEELKTSQFTSQDSGMRFVEANPALGTLQFEANRQLAFTSINTFVPSTSRPVVFIPTIQILPSRYSEVPLSYMDRDYYSVEFYDGDEWIGYVDIYQFYNRCEDSPNTYAWRSMFFGWSSATFELPIQINLKATDSGEHSIVIRKYYQDA